MASSLIPLLREIMKEPEEVGEDGIYSDSELMREYRYADISKKDTQILQTIHDLRKAGADEEVLQSWGKRWLEAYEEREETTDTTNFCPFMMAVFNWIPLPEDADETVEDLIRDKLRERDAVFEKEIQDFQTDEYGYERDNDTYELYENYAEKLQALAQSERFRHLLSELEFCAPTIAAHIEEHADDLANEDEDTVGWMEFL